MQPTCTRLIALFLVAASASMADAVPSAPAAPSGTTTPDQRQRLDALVPKLLIESKVPSVSIAHIRGGKIDVVVAYGEQAPGVPATETTIYNVASLTKPLAAETYLRFASQKSLPLDASMAEFWIDPDLAKDKRVKTLTPRLALSHRTGFPNWRYQSGGVLKFERDPATKFGYSGEGYEYLHAYLDRVSGSTLDALAKTLVFEPLNMSETRFGWQDALKTRIATPSTDGVWVKPDTSTEVLAADNLHTTARDYAKFLQGVIEGGGMSAAFRSEQTRVQVDRKTDMCGRMDAKDCPQEVGFGLGWEVYVFPETTMLMHTGNDRGESAIAIVDLKRRDAFVMLTNSNKGIGVAVGLLDVLELEPKFVNFLKKL